MLGSGDGVITGADDCCTEPVDVLSTIADGASDGRESKTRDAPPETITTPIIATLSRRHRWWPSVETGVGSLSEGFIVSHACDVPFLGIQR